MSRFTRTTPCIFNNISYFKEQVDGGRWILRGANRRTSFVYDPVRSD